MADIEGFETIAELLAAVIQTKDISQTKAAQMMGVSQPTLHHWLRGKTLPTDENLPAIAKFTGYSRTRLEAMRASERRGILSLQRFEDLETELRALRRSVDRIADRLEILERDS